MPVCDVLLLANPRLPGGSTRRLAQEIELLTAVGLRVSLLDVRPPAAAGTRPWSAAMLRVLAQCRVHVVLPGEEVEARVALARHPATVAGGTWPTAAVRAHRVDVIANQPLVASDGAALYDPAALGSVLAQRLGAAPTWWPTDVVTAPDLVAAGVDPALVHDLGWLDVAAALGGPVRDDDAPGDDPPADGAAWARAERHAFAALRDGRRPRLPAGAREVLGWTTPDPTPGDGAGDEAVVVAAVTSSLLHRVGLAAAPPAAPAPVAGPRRRPRVLFVTSNGAGMGHLTRELGIARELDRDVQPVFFSMSQAVPVVQRYGIPYEYVPFESALRIGTAEWNDYFAVRMARALRSYAPEAVVFDGVWPYRGLLDALKAYDGTTVWVRRGMWKPHISADQLARARRFDLVVEPGDYAAAYDTGATTQVDDAVRVDPVTVVGVDELLDPQVARAELGLPAQGPLALVTLGAGNINDIGGLQRQFVREIRALPGGWTPVVTQARIAAAAEPLDATVVSHFPLATHARAFDFAVSASGYNSYHEWINAALPTVWLPNEQTATDDQVARGRYAQDAGFGSCLLSPDDDDVRAAVREMADPEHRASLAARMRDALRPNGAAQAADAIRARLGVAS